MTDAGASVTQWIEELKQGEADALGRLWNRYFEQLTQLARRRLGAATRRVMDEEDVAVSVFRSLWRGAETRQFQRLTNRQDLWYLLATLTHRKSVDQVRRLNSQKRGGGRVHAASELLDGSHPLQGDLAAFLETEPTPLLLMVMDEEYHRLLKLLPQADLQHVAVARMEGYTNREIAGQLQLSERSVTRKIDLIRQRWEREVSNV